MANRNQYDHEGLLIRARELLGRKNPPVSWDGLARLLGMDRNTLRQSFRREFGISRLEDIVDGEIEGKAKRASEEDRETKEVEYGEGYINIVCASRRITSEEDVIREFKIDLNVWHVEKCKIKTSEGYRKDRTVEWDVDNGKVTRGRVKDSGKLLIAPLYHVQVSLIRKTEEVRARRAAEIFAEEAKGWSPKFPKIKRVKYKDGLMYEIDMPDIHFGKEAWREESGTDYGIEEARRCVRGVLERLLGMVHDKPVEKILLPFGNDFFNVDGKENATSHGTLQQEDTRWARTFREGKNLAFEMIEMCAGVAPVEVVIVPGNHDEERAFYLGEVLAAQYGRCDYVSVDNRAAKRKYFSYGKNLIGFTHGYHEKLKNLPALMPLEVPQLWASSKTREWHLGDKHHKLDVLHRTEDVEGVTVRLLRSLSGTDTWHFDKGYVGAPRGAEGFLWDKNDGVLAQFYGFV